MSLARFQDTFVRLATECEEPDSLEHRPHPLAQLPPGAVDRYARGLRAKRWDELRPLVPRTLVIEPRLGQRYRRWLARHPAPATFTVLGPGPAEGLRALGDLTADLDADEAVAPYAADLLAFEILMACSRLDGRERALRSVYDLRTLTHEIDRGLVPIDPPRGALQELRFHRGGVRTGGP